MAINNLRDGFVRLCFDPSANVLGERCRMVIEGVPSADAITGGDVEFNKLRKITSQEEADNLYGVGSQLSIALISAIECCGNGAVEVLALPRSVDVATATNAMYALTITGTAGSDGQVDIYAGEARWNISVRIDEGDTANDIAAKIAAEYPADFPYTVSATDNVVLFEGGPGEIGNGLNAMINWHGRNNYMPLGVTGEFAQTVVGVGTFEENDYEAVYGECCVCCHILLSNSTDQQDHLQDYLDSQWDCDGPQCFGHGYVYNMGSLGQILATDSNAASLSRLAHCPSDPLLPWLKVTAYGAQSCCLTIDNPELSIQGPNFGALECLKHPETCDACFTFDEQEQLREAGFVVTVPLGSGQGALTSPVVTNDITNNRYDAEGYENLTWRSVSSRRMAVRTATLIAEELQAFNGLGYFSEGTAVAEGTRGVNKRMMLGRIRAWAKTQIGILFSEFDNIDEDIQFVDDFEIAPRCQGQPGKVYLTLQYRNPVRIDQVVVNAVPKLLNNC